MNNPIIALEKIESLLLKWKNSNECPEAYYSSTKILLIELENLADERDLTSYTYEKLENVNWSVNAMFEADINNGHDFSKHLSFALGDISILKSKQCFAVLLNEEDS